MATDKKLITVKEAALILQRSPSAVYQAIRATPPRLHYADPLRRLIARDGLEERWSRSTRPRVYFKQPVPQRPKQSYWEQVAERANEMLDPDTWGPPPWPPERWAALAGVIDQATEAE